jgi:DNA topoisomerase VI subunit A
LPLSADTVDERFFSVLKTLAAAFKGGDPCQDLQRFSNGLKNTCRGDVIMVTDVHTYSYRPIYTVCRATSCDAVRQDCVICVIRERCCDFLNIFAEKICKKLAFLTQNKAKL